MSISEPGQGWAKPILDHLKAVLYKPQYEESSNGNFLSFAGLPSSVLVETATLIPEHALTTRHNGSPTVGQCVSLAREYEWEAFFSGHLATIERGDEHFAIDSITVNVPEGAGMAAVPAAVQALVNTWVECPSEFEGVFHDGRVWFHAWWD